MPSGNLGGLNRQQLNQLAQNQQLANQQKQIANQQQNQNQQQNGMEVNAPQPQLNPQYNYAGFANAQLPLFSLKTFRTDNAITFVYHKVILSNSVSLSRKLDLLTLTDLAGEREKHWQTTCSRRSTASWPSPAAPCWPTAYGQLHRRSISRHSAAASDASEIWRPEPGPFEPRQPPPHHYTIQRPWWTEASVTWNQARHRCLTRWTRAGRIDVGPAWTGISSGWPIVKSS